MYIVSPRGRSATTQQEGSPVPIRNSASFWFCHTFPYCPHLYYVNNMFKANRKKKEIKRINFLQSFMQVTFTMVTKKMKIFFMKSLFWGLQNISLYSSSSPLGLVLKHTHRLGSSEAKEKQKSICPLSSSENCQVVAGLGLLPESHLLVLACDHAAQEAFGLFADALPAPAVGHASRVVLLAVFPQADLSDDALKQILHIVVKGRGRLDKLAVKYYSAGASLCKGTRCGRADVSTLS